MAESRLLVDIGNSRIKWVHSRGDEIDPATAVQGDLQAFARALDADGGSAEEALIASVAAPEFAKSAARLCAETGIKSVRCLRTRDGQGGVRCAYAEPEKLGVDRWLALVGAACHHGKPVIAWDLGTATTLDAVDAEGRHLGGWILPGPRTMLSSLGANTRLPTPGDASDPHAGEPGPDTAAAIRRGILAAQLGALDRFVAAARNACGAQPAVVVTGGAAAWVLTHATGRRFVHDPWLVFRGMLVD